VPDKQADSSNHKFHNVAFLHAKTVNPFKSGEHGSTLRSTRTIITFLLKFCSLQISMSNGSCCTQAPCDDVRVMHDTMSEKHVMLPQSSTATLQWTSYQGRIEKDKEEKHKGFLEAVCCGR
jgi:hypothetical protein